jgi:hypothetical protein
MSRVDLSLSIDPTHTGSRNNQETAFSLIGAAG